MSVGGAHPGINFVQHDAMRQRDADDGAYQQYSI
jgi:hypothetical protein